MLDDAPLIEQPDLDDVYANYRKTRAMLGVEPVSRERAQTLIAEWSAALTVDGWNRRYGVQCPIGHGGALRARETQ